MPPLLRKAFRIVLITGMVLVLAYIAIHLNHYFYDERLLFYATGTEHKAFFNATWKMSPREVERANSVNLRPVFPAYNPFTLFVKNPDYDMPEYVMDTLRMSKFEHSVRLWGMKCSVFYTFFDDKLYKYEVAFECTDTNDVLSVIIPALSGRFGEPVDSVNVLFRRWKNNDETVWIVCRSSDNGRCIVALVNVKFDKYLREVREEVAEEQESYF